MKGRFKSWTQAHPWIRRGPSTLCLIVAASLLVVEILVLHFSLDYYELNFDCSTGEVTFCAVYKGGRSKTLGAFSESTGNADQLFNPMYAGNAPVSTSYDPRAMYEAGVDVPYFEYNRGADYGEYGSATFDEDTGILKIKLGEYIISWVDADGVIASAAIIDGEPCVAFYEHTTSSESTEPAPLL